MFSALYFKDRMSSKLLSIVEYQVIIENMYLKVLKCEQTHEDTFVLQP